MKARPKVVIHNHYARPARDNWYHDSQVNGYYILRGTVGDEGRWLVRNGKYDIVKTAGSKSEAVSFAKQNKNGGAAQEQIAADASGVRIVQNKLLGGWFVVRGPQQTPISGRFPSKEAAEEWLETRGSKDTRTKDATVEGKVVKVGDVVGFKSDYEQYGKITAINGNKLTLHNPDGFGGEYLRYAKTTVERSEDCWLR